MRACNLWWFTPIAHCIPCVILIIRTNSIRIIMLNVCVSDRMNKYLEHLSSWKVRLNSCCYHIPITYEMIFDNAASGTFDVWRDWQIFVATVLSSAFITNLPRWTMKKRRNFQLTKWTNRKKRRKEEEQILRANDNCFVTQFNSGGWVVHGNEQAKDGYMEKMLRDAQKFFELIT